MSEERVTLTIHRDGWTGELQISIDLVGHDGSGHGFRLAGPKFNGSGMRLLRKELDERDAQEIRSYLDRVFPREAVTP